MPYLKLRNLSVYYKDSQVVSDISLDIPDNQITAIIGPSGCGKTTLLKCINRLLDLYEEASVKGKAFIDDINIYDSDCDLIALRKKIGYLSQRPYPLPMSIYDNIAFGPRIHNIDSGRVLQRIEELQKHNKIEGFSIDNLRVDKKANKRKATDMLVEYYLHLAGLWDEVKDRLSSPASRLSIGQQQRLALARALAVEPEVILADEPTLALDPVSSQLIENQFKMLKQQYSIIMVTHILRQARRVADYVVFLYMGELVEHGPAEKIFKNPENERTKAYISGVIS